MPCLLYRRVDNKTRIPSGVRGPKKYIPGNKWQTKNRICDSAIIINNTIMYFETEVQVVMSTTAKMYTWYRLRSSYGQPAVRAAVAP